MISHKHLSEYEIGGCKSILEQKIQTAIIAIKCYNEKENFSNKKKYISLLPWRDNTSPLRDSTNISQNFKETKGASCKKLPLQIRRVSGLAI